jgi:hypothetical protein
VQASKPFDPIGETIAVGDELERLWNLTVLARMVRRGFVFKVRGNGLRLQS